MGASLTLRYSKSYDDQNIQGGTATPQSTSALRLNHQPSYHSSDSGQVGSGYAGYGWSWGPGTPIRDAPGRRF